jgi:hypothetical protein
MTLTIVFLLEIILRQSHLNTKSIHGPDLITPQIIYNPPPNPPHKEITK